MDGVCRAVQLLLGKHTACQHYSAGIFPAICQKVVVAAACCGRVCKSTVCHCASVGVNRIYSLLVFSVVAYLNLHLILIATQRMVGISVCNKAK
jgi:hypothetical protein